MHLISSIPLLTLISSSLFACHVAATASEITSVPNPKPRGDSVRYTIATNQSREAVREEERSPPLFEAVNQQADLEKLRHLFHQVKLPLISVEEIKESYNPGYHRGLATLYIKLKQAFRGKKLDQVLALAVKHFVREEDHPLRDVLNLIRLERKRARKKMRNMLKNRSKDKRDSQGLGRQDVEDDKLEKALKALSLKVSEDIRPQSADQQVVLQKLRSLVGNPNLPLMSLPVSERPIGSTVAYFREILFLDQKLEEMFGTHEEMKMVSTIAKNHYEGDGGEIEPILIEVYLLLDWKDRLGAQKLKETLIKESGT